MVRAKLTTVKLVNRGHIGDNINSGVLSFVERLTLLGGQNVLELALGKDCVGLCPIY